MRILFLLTQDIESPSGLGRYWPLARELAARQHDVTIAALHSNYKDLKQKYFIRDNVKLCYVAPMHIYRKGNVKHYYSPLQLLWVTFFGTLALTYAATTIPVDIIYIGKPHPMNGIAGLISKYIRKRQIIVDCDDIETAINRFGSKWQQRIVAFFERWLPRQADCVTTHTYYNYERLIQLGVNPNKLKYLSNGIDRKRFKSPSQTKVDELRSLLDLNGKKVIGYIGSMGMTSHPVNLLLDAFPLILDKEPNSILLLVGAGEDYEALQQQANRLGLGSRVIFCGRVVPEEVILYYLLAELTVDPVYDNEAARGRSPLKLFESWACGIPFVTSDVGDRKYLLGNPPAGKLAPPGDAKALAQAIIEILRDQQLAISLRQLGLQKAHSYFWDVLTEEFEHICQDILLTSEGMNDSRM